MRNQSNCQHSWALILAGILCLFGGHAGAQEPTSPVDDASTSPDTIIIGIHGLLNKPPADQLQEWWAQAIQEGLQRNQNWTSSFPFELAYWANVRNAQPIALDVLDEPYVAAPGTGPLSRFDPEEASKLRAVANKVFGWVADKEKEISGFGASLEQVIGISFKDLADYYQKKNIRNAIREQLLQLLLKYSDKNIILIAHSMGSIVAYDVLRLLEVSLKKPVKAFLTIGSPLGLPIVGLKVTEEFGERRTPENVQRWINLADPGDKVALDINLADEYGPNEAGVKVQDVLVHNEYQNPAGKANNHKSYGYLRTPEVSEILKEFLQ